jgi:hypothetical protein
MHQVVFNLRLHQLTLSTAENQAKTFKSDQIVEIRGRFRVVVFNASQ